MPIHTSWSSMIRGMKNTYCKKGDKMKARPLTNGKKISSCKKGWSVFFATLRKRGWDDTKPRPKKVSETVFNEAVKETMKDFVETYSEKLRKKQDV